MVDILLLSPFFFKFFSLFRLRLLCVCCVLCVIEVVEIWERASRLKMMNSRVKSRTEGDEMVDEWLCVVL